MTSRAAIIVALAALAVASCKKKPPSIAELTKADGPVDRQQGDDGEWTTAEIGTEYYIGDAARTSDRGGAQLKLIGNAQIAMQPQTVLRFRGSEGTNRISVENGAIDLTGTGTYKTDVG